MNSADLTISSLNTLDEALELAEIRNECRHMMTNFQNEISPEDQKKWYLENYLRQSSPPSYLVWLLKKVDQSLVGYFAVKIELDSCFITEGIKSSCRGKGLGSFLLDSFCKHKIFKGRKVFADILNANEASINLHKKFGFKYHTQINPETTRYILIC